MPYKIVKTIEKGKPRLCVVPSQWKDCGILRWPKKFADRLVFDESSKPGPEWSSITCTVKRQGFTTYESADTELQIMCNSTETDQENEIHQRPRATNKPNFNSLAEHLILPQNISEAAVNLESTSTHHEAFTFFIVSNDQISQAPENVPDIQHALLQNQATLIDITNNIALNQKKMMQKLASLSVQLEESISKIDSYLYSEVITLKDASRAEKESFIVKQIKTAQDLEEMEESLSNDEYVKKLAKSCSTVCSGGVGKGVTCAYRLVDVLFSREFLCECSWSGSTRQDGVKISLKCYKKTVQFFFKVINQLDNTYTHEDNKTFFKNILKNANKRKSAKNERIPTKRHRTKRIKPKNTPKDITLAPALASESRVAPGSSREANVSASEPIVAPGSTLELREATVSASECSKIPAPAAEPNEANDENNELLEENFSFC